MRLLILLGDNMTRVLIAEDDPVSRYFLETTLGRWGYDVSVAVDGKEAWRRLEGEDRPAIAILDWMMPEIDGIEICRRLRSIETPTPVYIIMLTARSEKEDVIAGLQAGADDYVTKPFNRQELRARLNVGARIVELQRSLAARVKQLEEALSQVKQLRGLLPICSYCKKIRDDQNYWQQVDSYISAHSDIEFSHSICPACFDKFVEPEMEKLGQK